MGKVVYNACFGGFSISKEAGEWLLAHGIEEPFKGRIKRELKELETNQYGWYGYMFNTSQRHHPLLVQCVEELGDAADGSCSDLEIEEVEDKYRIEEYDGMETVYTPDYEYEWISSLTV